MDMVAALVESLVEERTERRRLEMKEERDRYKEERDRNAPGRRISLAGSRRS
jgi:hypothetical protein